MKRTDKISLKLSETRTKLGELLDIEKRSEDQQAEIERLTQECRNLDKDYQSALLAEPDPKPEITQQEDNQGREIRDLLGKAKLGNYAREAVDRGNLDGVEHELRQALIPGTGYGYFPIDLLQYEPRPETRADESTSPATSLFEESHADPLARIFARSVAGRLGVQMPMVGSGERVYPVMTAGNTAAMRAKGTAHDANAATFSTTSLEPRRLTARYLFHQQDALGMDSLETTLRRDLSMAVQDRMDAIVLNGSGTAPEPQGIIPALSVTAAGTNDTFTSALKKLFDCVDGLHAYSMNDLRVVVGPTTWEKSYGLVRSDTQESMWGFGRRELADFFVSGHVPAAASNVQTTLVARTSVPGANAVAPVWRAGQLIRDEYTEACR